MNWTSSNGSLLTIGTNGLASAVAIGSVTVTATYQGKMATTPSFLVTAAAVASIAVTPLNASITTGATEQYVATATYTDSSTERCFLIGNVELFDNKHSVDQWQRPCDRRGRRKHDDHGGLWIGFGIPHIRQYYVDGSSRCAAIDGHYSYSNE